MAQIVIKNAVVKGYHEFQIRPPINLPLPVTKEYGDKHDPHACLVWVPELDSIPVKMWSTVTDIKRGETVHTIAGLPIGRVPHGLSSCFTELLSSTNVNCIEWYFYVIFFIYVYKSTLNGTKPLLSNNSYIITYII